MTLLICRTCPRYDRRATGQFARDLTAAVRADGRDIPTRNVQCLGGCPDDNVIAVDGPSKTRVRFTSITSDDATAIINATLAHQASSTGNPGDWLIPAELTCRISSVTVKRQTDAPGQISQPSQAPHLTSPPNRHRPWDPVLSGLRESGLAWPGGAVIEDADGSGSAEASGVSGRDCSSCSSRPDPAVSGSSRPASGFRSGGHG